MGDYQLNLVGNEQNCYWRVQGDFYVTISGFRAKEEGR